MLKPADFTFVSVMFRLFLACLSGGVIGYGRTKRRRTAGFRTFMLTGIGAALSILLAMYETEMFKTFWKEAVEIVGTKFDASRYAAQVLSGVGFLAAGSIIAIAHQQVEGLTTATGLFASVCMGLAAGAGYYLCVFVSLILILLALNVMAPLEVIYKRKHRNIMLTVEFEDMSDIEKITELIRNKDAAILGIDIEQTEKVKDRYPSAIFSMKLSREHPSHSDMLSSIAELPYVYGVEELIA